MTDIKMTPSELEELMARPNTKVEYIPSNILTGDNTLVIGPSINNLDLEMRRAFFGRSLYRFKKVEIIEE